MLAHLDGRKLAGMANEKPRAKPIPDDSQHATPYLSVRDGAKAIEFYRRAFSAVELIRMDQPDGRVGHAELRIGKAHFMLADEFPSMGHVGPQTLGGTSVTISLYVEDVDKFVEHAVSQGAKVARPVADQFYGDRVGVLEDPFGHRWSFSTRLEDLTPEEMQKRARESHGE